MKFFGWLKSGKNKNNEVNIKKISEDSINQGAMASASPVEAARSMSRMAEQNASATKVLVVQDGNYSAKVTEYALKMAQKLDCEIVSLDVTEIPNRYNDERQERETNRFHERSKRSFESFSLQGDSMGVTTSHFMVLGDQEEAIAQMSIKDVGIRYVLTKPENEHAEAEQGRMQVPVFDLNCSR